MIDWECHWPLYMREGLTRSQWKSFPISCILKFFMILFVDWNTKTGRYTSRFVQCGYHSPLRFLCIFYSILVGIWFTDNFINVQSYPTCNNSLRQASNLGKFNRPLSSSICEKWSKRKKKEGEKLFFHTKNALSVSMYLAWKYLLGTLFLGPPFYVVIWVKCKSNHLLGKGFIPQLF